MRPVQRAERPTGRRAYGAKPSRADARRPAFEG